ncbi:MAG: NAD(+) diphosphatase [Desulfobacteraceae bacterium]|nr:MAG: NAD(+) diphosphatase [Desulfobacteraceae bacterium]
MGFVASIRPAGRVKGPSWCFAFSGQKIVVEKRNERISLPLSHDPHSFGLDSPPIYLGALNGVDCLAGEITEGRELPETMTLVGLRQLFLSVEEDLYLVAGRAFQLVEFERNHRFCGKCGAPNQDKPNERAKICPNCGIAVFPRMSPAIIVAIRNKGRILLARAPRFPEGMYSVIAGFVEPGESLEQCVQREVREEVGIEVTGIRYFGSQSWPFPNSLMVAFTAEYAEGEIRVDQEEIEDAGWFTPETLPRIPDRISISRKLIDAFLKEVSSKQ